MCLGGRVKLLTMPAEEAVEAGAVTETEMSFADLGGLLVGVTVAGQLRRSRLPSPS